MKTFKFHKYIDNGGISIQINLPSRPIAEDVFEQSTLDINASYFGYPCVLSWLEIHTLTPKDLADIGNLFHKAANYLEERNLTR